jgi:hypothetical protein
MNFVVMLQEARMVRRLSLAFILTLVLLSGLVANPANAGAANFAGIIDAADPAMAVVFISTPNCTGQGATLVHYESMPFSVDAAGSYTFTMSFTGTDVSFYVFAGSFNPAAAFPTCIAGDNSGNPKQVSVALAPGTLYYAVPFDDTFAQTGGTYSMAISGPGNITLGGLPAPAGAPGPDMVPLPATAVVGAFVATTPIYFAPRADAVTTVIMEAGKTVWVFGLDASGQYYKAVISGKYFWVPKATMGPNYDKVWLGRPLPTVVVE